MSSPNTQRQFFTYMLLDDGLVQDVRKDVLQDSDMPPDVPLIPNITSNGGTITITSGGANLLNLEVTTPATIGPMLIAADTTSQSVTNGTATLFSHNLTAGQFANLGDVVEWVVPVTFSGTGDSLSLSIASTAFSIAAGNATQGRLIARVQCTTLSDPNSVLSTSVDWVSNATVSSSSSSQQYQAIAGLTLASAQTFSLSATAGSGTITATNSYMNYWPAA